MTARIHVLIPVYNDWQSLRLLIRAIGESNPPAVTDKLCITVVDDASPDPIPSGVLGDGFDAEVVHLSRNLGHQRAIATGLAYLNENKDCEAVVVMDADGEDRPGDVASLHAALTEESDRIIFARRTQRQEGLVFRVSYWIYKGLHRLLTGKQIAFGNFSIVPGRMLRQVASVSEIWNHFSGGIIRSNIPFGTIGLSRGKRLAGRSKMNFPPLILHGLSSISVSSDIMAIRILILSLIFIILTAAGMLTVVGIKLLTDLAIPGWASTIVLGLAMLLAQIFLIALFLVFTVLNYRTQPPIIPSKHYRDYVGSVEFFSSDGRSGEVRWGRAGAV